MFLVEVSIVGALNLAVALGRDDNFCPAVGYLVCKMIGVVAFVRNGGISVDAIDQIVGEGDVIALAGRSNQTDRQAKDLGSSLDFCAQASARPTQALGIRPPLSLRAPAAY
ncbi:hypothetical protein FHS82_004220 [Pseudochelatococcus lubricantis]|uniref:Uncharacterized protein n=1 Tax=Pseudochelatococcus lubricantis TaxID=1538102 RepID=A0ABX0V5Z0_9HYPH|nr:hypothetical protein [Pseudochelatococcus lubricantis]